MPIQNKPDEKIFASNAKPREVDNFPDINRGWGFTFEQTGGIPTMEHFNALFKRNDEHLMYLLQRGVPEWSSTIDYPQGACVQYQGKTYRSLTQNRSQTPATGSQHWTLWGLTIADIPEVRPASLTAAGITQLDNAINSNAEDRAATPKAVKQVNDKVERNARSLNERIPNSKKSDVVNSNSSDTVATSRAVKTAYDLANSKQSPATTLAGYGITDFQLRAATGNLNDYRTAGIYSINSIHNSYNRPAEGVQQSQGFTGNLQVITGGAGNESWCHQIFRRHYSGETYERWQTASNNNSWSEWKRTDNSQLAQNLQDKADRAHTHTVSQITDFNPEVVKLINQHSGFTQNISTNGWTVLPNGLMIQWGVATTNNILFPRAFPRECFIVSHSKTGGGRDTRISNVSRTGFTSSATVTVGTTYYVAIGH